MPIQVACPACARQLRVPDSLLGQNVKCPNCEATFSAAEPPPPTDAYRETAEPPPRRREEDAPPSRPRPRFDRVDDSDDDDDDMEFRRRRRGRRSYLPPHRGGTVLTTGILSIVLSFAFCPLIGFMGIGAWVMGQGDLRTIREGRMDPSGEGQTRTGMILGIIGTAIGVLTVFGIVAAVAYHNL